MRITMAIDLFVPNAIQRLPSFSCLISDIPFILFQLEATRHLG
jgi:hypothetical protein